jgi:hypothetical protein
MEGLDGYMARILGWVVVCEAARKNGRVRDSSGYEVQVWTDQRPTTHGSCVIDRPSRTRLFQSLAIKQLALYCEFKVVNALVINHWWLWRLEMPLRFPCRRACRFRWLSREKQRERSHGWHVQCLGMNANRSQPTLLSALSSSTSRSRSGTITGDPNPTL